MKKWILCFGLLCANQQLPHNTAYAGEINHTHTSSSSFENYARNLYNDIDFGNHECLSFEVFLKAYTGYINLKQAGKLNTEKEVITICDMSLSSTRNRLWIIDLKQKKLLCNTYVAHGRRSGDEHALRFSNHSGSKMTSLGFYVTAETYEGEHGLSLHLQGMDAHFNDAAYKRGIVVHGADYVSDKHIAGNDYLGRSWGCPAVPGNLSQQIIATIKDNTCLFIYYPDKNYLNRSTWLNRKVQNFFAGIDKPALNTPSNKKS
jgi:hypothetical protein